MKSISTPIITKNEESNISKCLESLKGIADEIIVYDCASTDKTVEIATAFGAKVFCDTNWLGFGKQRIKAQSKATMDYCLWLDADEVIPLDLATEIKSFVAENHPTKILNISRKNFIYNYHLKHGGCYPNRVLRLYKRNHTNYNDSMVHEKIILKDDSIIINSKNDLIHYTYDSFFEMNRKQLMYSEEWAKNRLNKTNKGCLIITPFVSATFAFIKHYILQAGFLDGKFGYVVCCSIASYTFCKYIALYSIYKEQMKQKRDSFKSKK